MADQNPDNDNNLEALIKLEDNTLNTVFELVKTHARVLCMQYEDLYEVNKCDTLFNGKEFWQPIKELLKPLDIYTTEHTWNAMFTDPKELEYSNPTYIQPIMRYTEFSINGLNEKSLIPENHFIIQTVHIPTTQQATIRKIVQIALNIGQFEGHRYADFADVNEKIFHHTNDMNLLYGYVYTNAANILSKHITQDLIDKIKYYVSNPLGIPKILDSNIQN
jgi:hypothetical protein